MLAFGIYEERDRFRTRINQRWRAEIDELKWGERKEKKKKKRRRRMKTFSPIEDTFYTHPTAATIANRLCN